jgi:diacylglycerol kinase (CTP)
MQPSYISPYIIGALVPVATADYLRFTFPSFNRIYVRVLGALMRETEFDAWNGVIWYMLGVWIILTFFPKDVGIVGVLLLSWCDTAASTVGRAYGRYTQRIRKGKSLAGSLAAFLVGVVTAVAFWGWLAPLAGQDALEKDGPFMFTGTLRLPGTIRNGLSLTDAQGSITGGAALTVWSLWTGFVASASEVVDLFGWDDNLTIPVLSGIGMWAFLKAFG